MRGREEVAAERVVADRERAETLEEEEGWEFGQNLSLASEVAVGGGAGAEGERGGAGRERGGAGGERGGAVRGREEAAAERVVADRERAEALEEGEGIVGERVWGSLR